MSGVNESATTRVTAALTAIDAVDRPEIWIKVRSRDDLLAEAARIDAALEAAPNCRWPDSCWRSKTMWTSPE